MTEDVLRAAKLSRVPGVTIAEAAKKTGVSQAAIRRARKDVALTRDDLLLAALTHNGEAREGAVNDARLASWLDYVNHDGTTADEVRDELQRLAAAGRLALDGARFRLLTPWP